MQMNIMMMVNINLGRINDPQHGVDLARIRPQHFVAHQAFWALLNLTTNNMTAIYRDCLPSKIWQAKLKVYFWWATTLNTASISRSRMGGTSKPSVGITIFRNNDPQGSVVLGSLLSRISPKSGLRARRLRL